MKKTTVTIWDDKNNCAHTFEQPANWESRGDLQRVEFIKQSIKGVFEQRENNASWRDLIFNRRGDKANIHNSIRERTQETKDLIKYDRQRKAAENKSNIIFSAVGFLFLSAGFVAARWVWVNVGALAIIGCVFVFLFFLGILRLISR